MLIHKNIVTIRSGGVDKFRAAAAGTLSCLVILGLLMAAMAPMAGKIVSWKSESLLESTSLSSSDVGVALVRLVGTITPDMSDGEITPSKVRRLLASAAADDDIKAVLLEMDTPGGGAAASDIIHHEILSFRKLTGKPVVVHSSTLLASGGFYAAQAADKVVLSPAASGGSIGVIMSTYDASGLGDKLGIRKNVFRTGPLKGMGDWGRPMTEAEKSKARDMVDDFKARFVKIVAEGRGMTVEKAASFATGEVWSGDRLLSMGLVDATGYLDGMGDILRTELSTDKPVKYLEMSIKTSLADKIAAGGRKLAAAMVSSAKEELSSNPGGLR